MGTARKIFLILIILILIIWVIVVFLIIPQWPIYILLGLALLVALYLFFREDRKRVNKPNDPPLNPKNPNPNYNPNKNIQPNNKNKNNNNNSKNNRSH